MHDYAKEKAEDHFDMLRRKEMATVCKNSNYTGIIPVEGSKEYEHTWSNSGCKNPRRNGSAYCQECSNKHHEEKK